MVAAAQIGLRLPLRRHRHAYEDNDGQAYRGRRLMNGKCRFIIADGKCASLSLATPVQLVMPTMPPRSASPMLARHASHRTMPIGRDCFAMGIPGPLDAAI